MKIYEHELIKSRYVEVFDLQYYICRVCGIEAFRTSVEWYISTDWMVKNKLHGCLKDLTCNDIIIAKIIK